MFGKFAGFANLLNISHFGSAVPPGGDKPPLRVQVRVYALILIMQQPLAGQDRAPRYVVDN